MKIDFDLIRHILKSVADLQPGKTLDNINYPGYDKATIHEHIKILEDERLINATTFRRGTSKTVRKFNITGLTWNGDKFLQDMGNDSFFKKTKDSFVKSGSAFFISAFWEFLKLKLKEKTGLP